MAQKLSPAVQTGKHESGSESFFLCFWSTDIWIDFLQLGQLCVYHCHLLLHLFKVLGELLYALYWTCMWLVIIIIFFVFLWAMWGWMTLFVTLVAFLVCPILLIILIFSVLFYSLTFSSSSTPFWVNEDPSDLMVFGAAGLLYLSSKWRVCCWFLGYRLSLVVKSFWRSVLRFVCCLALCHRNTYDKYHSSASIWTACWSAAVRAANACWCTSCATYSSSTLCCWVMPLTLATSTLVLKCS